MAKSFQPTNPNGRKTQPDWTQEEGVAKVMALITDDAEFGPGYIQFVPTETLTDEEGAVSIVKEAHYLYANKRGDKWYTVFIDADRVASYTGAKKLPY